MQSEQALLGALGRRLRRTREAAGVSLSEVARRSGLSRRYLTEAEAGRANPSLLKLARLAEALDCGLPALCDLKPRARPGERIALVGLRGAGKSTVGRELALALEAPFIELDQRVEQLAGLTLAEIFDLHGVATFHRLEREALEEVLAGGQRLVLATSGSIVSATATFERLCEACRTVWLRAEPEDHLARVLDQGDRRPSRGRPQAMDELRALLVERRPSYEQCEYSIDTSGKSVGQVVGETLGRLA